MRYVEPVRCGDGTIISIQANSTTFCDPQSNFGPWDEFSVRVNDGSKAKGLRKYEQPSSSGVVYHYVPRELVSALIEAHGGTDDDWEGFEPPSVDGIMGMRYNDACDAARAMGVEEALAALAAIITDRTVDRETRQCAAERARWVAGLLY